MTHVKGERIQLSNSDKLALITNFSTLLAAGIPILETVESILEESKGNQKKMLDILRADISQGKHVYESFARFPRIFDKVTISIIRASEESGTLDVALKDLRVSIKKDIEFGDKIKGALAYPLMIVVVFIGVLLAILTFVIPKISTVFSRLRVELPLPTKILIFVSNTLLAYTIPIIIGVIILGVGAFFLYKEQKRLFLNVFLSFPLVSTLAKQIDLTRFTHSLYLLLSSGVPITNALELVQEVVLKKEVKQAVSKVRETVASGRKISEGFRSSRHIFPTIMIKISEAGEKSGSLDKSMQDISDQLEYEVSQTLRTVTTLIEPIMLVAVGLMVGGMMLAIIAPIYGLIGQVGNR